MAYTGYIVTLYSYGLSGLYSYVIYYVVILACRCDLRSARIAAHTADSPRTRRHPGHRCGGAMRVGTRVDMRVHMRVHVLVGMSVDMRVDTHVGMRVGMCVDMRVGV